MSITTFLRFLLLGRLIKCAVSESQRNDLDPSTPPLASYEKLANSKEDSRMYLIRLSLVELDLDRYT